MSLPSAYQEVEYIESSGTQYIDVWYKTNRNISTKLCISQNMSYVSEYAIFWDAWSENALFLMAYQWYFRYHFSFNWQNVVAATADKTEIETSNTWIKINWTNYSYTAWSTFSNYNIHIFNSWDNSNTAKRWRFKLYYFKLYDNWTLVRDFVPCYRKSDDVIWLYDLVNDTFYTNSWTWTFTKWPDAITEWYVISRILWWWPANDGTATNKQRLIWGTEPPPPPTPVLFEIETDFRNYSNISDVYALWWWAWAKGSMSPAVNTSYWFYCSNYSSAWWWQWLYYDISSYMANAKKIYAHLTWYMPWWYTYQANERIVLCNISRIDGTWETTASDIFQNELKWWNYNNNTNIGKAVGWASYTKLVDYWSSNYTWDVDITFEINLESWLVTSVITQPSSISMQYTLSASEISWIKSTLKFIDFAFTTYATWINNYIKTAHIKIE